MVRGLAACGLLALVVAGCASTAPPPQERAIVTCGPPMASAISPPAPPQSGPPPSSASPSVPPAIWRQPKATPANPAEAIRPGSVLVDSTTPSALKYLKEVGDRIRQNWVYPQAAGVRGIEGVARLTSFVAKDGGLETVRVEASSGTKILDDAALTAVKLAQPFPRIPDDLCRETLGITQDFRYAIPPKR